MYKQVALDASEELNSNFNYILITIFLKGKITLDLSGESLWFLLGFECIAKKLIFTYTILLCDIKIISFVAYETEFSIALIFS